MMVYYNPSCYQRILGIVTQFFGHFPHPIGVLLLRSENRKGIFKRPHSVGGLTNKLGNLLTRPGAVRNADRNPPLSPLIRGAGEYTAKPHHTGQF